MKTAEEYWQEKNGGKSSSNATNDNELITPVYAVLLMEQYASLREKETAKYAMGHGIVLTDEEVTGRTYPEVFEEWYIKYKQL